MSSINILTDIENVKNEITMTVNKLNLLMNKFQNAFQDTEQSISKIKKFKTNKIKNFKNIKFTTADTHTIQAMLNGYISDKEIYFYLEKIHVKFNVRYQISKLMFMFEAPNRTFLLQVLIANYKNNDL